MDVTAAKDALMALHRDFLPRAYDRGGLSAVLTVEEMQRLCEALIDGAIAIEKIQQKLRVVSIVTE